MSSIYDWSTEASANGNSDDLINWQEGQPPSSVNNSARAMMQRIAEYLQDVNATAKATGTSLNVQVQIKSPITKLFDGFSIKFIATADNVANATLNINNTGAKPIYKNGLDGIVQLAGGEMRNGAVYEAVYNAALNAGAGGWFLMTIAPQQSEPSGKIAYFASSTAPSGWLECDGRAISRVTYGNLFNAIGTKFGTGDGTTTFNVPELRGEFIRVWDNGRGIDKARNFASFQDSDNKAHNHTAATSDAGDHSHTYQFHHNTASHGSGQYYNMITPDSLTTWNTGNAGLHRHNVTIDNSGGSESRPRNVALLCAIKV